MEPFSQYNLPHIVAIGLTFLSCLLSTKLVKSKKQAKILRHILIISLIIKILWYHLWLVFSEHNLTLQRHLPLHISQIAIILMIAALSIRRNFFYQFIYYWAGWSSLLALFFPELSENFPHLRFLEFFFGYLLLLTGISYICSFEKIRMTYQYLWIVAGSLASYCIFVYPINLILGTNFVFLIEKPKLDILPSPPWHIPFLVLVVLLLLHLQYLPYFISQKRRVHRGNL